MGPRECVEPYSAACVPGKRARFLRVLGFGVAMRVHPAGPARADYVHRSTLFSPELAITSLNLRLSWRRAFPLRIAHASPHKRAVASSVRLWVPGALGGAGGGLQALAGSSRA